MFEVGVSSNEFARPMRRDFKRPSAKELSGPRYPSPLRYPGAKRKLVPTIRRLLSDSRSKPDLLVELFAGGASVALSLLWTGDIASIGLVDSDPLVSSFWEVLFSDSDWLISRVADVEVTVEKWQEIRAWCPVDDRGRALKCLFLNRTSFSGILHGRAGPIGGQSQQSAYRIDCRFNRANLSRRLTELAALSDKVKFVHNLDWQVALTWVEERRAAEELPTNVLYYLDPPFFDKSHRLYSHHFGESDHERLRDALVCLERPWILSYDRLDRVKELYGDLHGGPWEVDGLYTASSRGGRHATEAMLTNLPRGGIASDTPRHPA